MLYLCTCIFIFFMYVYGQLSAIKDLYYIIYVCGILHLYPFCHHCCYPLPSFTAINAINVVSKTTICFCQCIIYFNQHITCFFFILFTYLTMFLLFFIFSMFHFNCCLNKIFVIVIVIVSSSNIHHVII